MGYTQKLGLLAQSVFQDSSLNVGIGAAPSGTYKFEVTGTAKVSSTLLVSGVATIGGLTSTGVISLTPSTFSVGSATATDSNSLTLQAANSNYLLRFKNAAGSSVGGFYYDGTNLIADSLYKFTNNVQIGSLASGSQGSINGASGTINRAIVNCPYPGASALTLGYYSAGYGLDIWVNGDGTGLAPVYIDQRQNEAIIFRRSTYGTAVQSMRIHSGGNIILGTSAADFNGERLRISGSTSASTPAMAITSANPNVSCPNGTATTVYTFPSYPRVMYYMVFVRIDTGTNANDYATYAVVAASSVGSKLMTVVNGTYITLTLSGLNVQINQSSGATQNAVVSVIQIFANGGSD